MTNEEKPQEGAADDTREGIQQKTVSELDRADEIAERQKRENDRREELIYREELLAARKAVGGVADGGQESEKPKEETAEEYSKRILSGNVEK